LLVGRPPAADLYPAGRPRQTELGISLSVSTVKLSGRYSLLIHFPYIQKGQGMVEYALILALIALIVIIALIATGGQLVNVYSNITATMCNYHVGC
jgi:Flp pilus assembly pilin Flp